MKRKFPKQPNKLTQEVQKLFTEESENIDTQKKEQPALILVQPQVRSADFLSTPQFSSLVYLFFQ